MPSSPMRSDFLSDEPEYDLNDLTHVFYLPWERFLIYKGGRWHTETPLSEKAFVAHLVAEGIPLPAAKEHCKTSSYPKAYGMIQNFAEDRAVYRDGGIFINTIIRPTMKPEVGPYPTIQRILEHHSPGDENGWKWMEQWFAQKVQHPGILPRVALVLMAKPGAGKGTLYAIMRRMLGDENCAHVKLTTLESRFNASWADKLFILADEMSADMRSTVGRDLSDNLKIWVDNEIMEVEGKGLAVQKIHNRIAWMFASNEHCPVRIEKDDRRYSVFSNQTALSFEYLQSIRRCYHQAGPEKGHPTEAFLKEISGWYAHLLTVKVDPSFVGKPYQNTAREGLIADSASVHEVFFQEVDEHGIDNFIHEAALRDAATVLMREKDWAVDGGIAADALYRAYRHYVKENGGRPMAKHRFGSITNHHRPNWTIDQIWVDGKNTRIRRNVPRTPQKPQLKAL